MDWLEFVKGQMEATMRSNGSRKIAKESHCERKLEKDFMRKRTKILKCEEDFYVKIVSKPAQNIIASIKAFLKKMFTNFLNC